MTTAERYALQKRNQATLRQVNDLLLREADTVLGKAEGLAQQETGGYLRKVVPGMIDRYGKVNAAAAMKYYDAQRAEWLKGVNRAPTTSAGRNRRIRQNQNRNAERFASAKLQGQLYVARMPKFDAITKSEGIIGYGMSLLQEAGFMSMKDEMANAMTRAVASYNRDTLLYNSALDPNVVGVQRVAELGACDFCQMVAFGRDGQVRVGSYAANWHNNCKCSIETLYEGDQPYKPDYYDDFETGAPDQSTEEFAASWEQFKKDFPQKFVSN